MKNSFLVLLVLIVGVLFIRSVSDHQTVEINNPMFSFDDASATRWISFENSTGEKGGGGLENNGAKGHPFDRIMAGETKVLLDVKGPGIINRIWITIQDRSPEMLRGLVIRMYWDHSEKPAVEVPFGDFFGVGLGMTTVFENALFSNPEGRSFNSVIQMPFKTAARLEIINETGTDLKMIFYDVDIQLIEGWNDTYLYFHSFWQRDTLTSLGKDFELLPRVQGRGRFLGVNIGVQANPDYRNTWWGEGEVKMYLDGDRATPTLVGTGTEDYIGTAWGQGSYFNMNQGSPIALDSTRQWCFYRYHIPDPIYFRSDFRATIQQMGGMNIKELSLLQNTGVPMWPVSFQNDDLFIPLFQPGSVVDLDTLSYDDGWTNFYRQDDISATAYFYLDKPFSDLPAIQDLAIRQYKLDGNPDL